MATAGQMPHTWPTNEPLQKVCTARTPLSLTKSVAELRRRVWPSATRAGDRRTLLAAVCGWQSLGGSCPSVCSPAFSHLPTISMCHCEPHTLHITVSDVLVSAHTSLVGAVSAFFCVLQKASASTRSTGEPCDFYKVLSDGKRMLSYQSPLCFSLVSGLLSKKLVGFPSFSSQPFSLPRILVSASATDSDKCEVTSFFRVKTCPRPHVLLPHRWLDGTSPQLKTMLPRPLRENTSRLYCYVPTGHFKAPRTWRSS